ncbi:Fpg/Nei family DNA glycosylase [Streptomyces zagrosensis]|uniref:DNA-(apurinic or apyrimidinic site) lyase n=1 Tax=Streptomyces zagrosensis TaxID=1042984 RepID=A0A7W9QCZ3_9ACTN|nr:Fpg/Nei family DNA glycosylase [Streptomyces zagrosensis]MBB5937498.1 endonuclease-8 [Streptomyces zagrosensis]
MPEGDTVWRTAARLHAALAGKPLTRWELRAPTGATLRPDARGRRRPSLPAVDLTGRQVREVIPRGKHLLTRIEGGLTLHSHLRMDGAWYVYGTGERWRGGPGHQIRAILGVADRTAVGYRLPVLALLRTADEHTVTGHLGPDLLGPDWDPEEALRRLLAEPRRPLGEALLDQRNLAGIGNVYKAELCFLLRVSPWLPVSDLGAAQRERLMTLAKKLLEVNKTRSTRVTTAERHPNHQLWVYGRAGRPCVRCGTTIRITEQGSIREPAGSQARVTYWCPHCQPGPVPDPASAP